MDCGGGPSLFPLHRCKTIHLVRHAQGIHNVEGDKNYKAYLNPQYFDACLTQLGWHQVDNLRDHVRNSGLINRIDLVIASPLLSGLVNVSALVAKLTQKGFGNHPDLGFMWLNWKVDFYIPPNYAGSRNGLSMSLVDASKDFVIFDNASSIWEHVNKTLQTAVGVFGGEGYTDRTDVLPLMVANAGNSSRAAISSLNSPPIVAVELCREHLGVHPCDRRRSVSEYQYLFPAVDFSLIESDEDIWWKANIRETKEELAARGLKFLNWLWTRKEKEIAIVTHSGFLFHTLNAFGNDCHPLVKKEISKHFANCELRSMVIVDRSMTGSEASTTNYPGKIPSGLDLPSDAADENAEK